MSALSVDYSRLNGNNAFFSPLCPDSQDDPLYDAVRANALLVVAFAHINTQIRGNQHRQSLTSQPRSLLMSFLLGIVLTDQQTAKVCTLADDQLIECI